MMLVQEVKNVRQKGISSTELIRYKLKTTVTERELMELSYEQVCEVAKGPAMMNTTVAAKAAYLKWVFKGDWRDYLDYSIAELREMFR